MQDDASPTPVLSYGVGSTLKGAREKMDKPLAEVASQLRIRQPFLQALEEGRHKDLPGGTYAVGFLRTYAEFLGLDGEEMVRRFRAEAAGDLNARSELFFPSPSSEGRIPGGAVLFLGILLTGVAYGAWYWLSARDASVAELVPTLPDRFASALNRQATLPGEAARSGESAAKTDEPPTAKTLEPPAAAPAAAKEELVPPSEDEDKPAKPEPAKTEPTTPEPAKAEPAQTEPAKAEPPQAEPARAEAPTTEPANPVDLAKPDANAVPASVPAGKIIGQEHTNSRITLTAAGDDCWIQVRELDGQLLLSRLLRKGDSYIVPNRPGLSLMVGNAGALEITADGRKAPTLGTSGQVRRDIKLDVDKLLAGG